MKKIVLALLTLLLLLSSCSTSNENQADASASQPPNETNYYLCTKITFTMAYAQCRTTDSGCDLGYMRESIWSELSNCTLAKENWLDEVTDSIGENNKSMNIPHSNATYQDEDGCWLPHDSCIEAKGQWEDYSFISYFTNVCHDRIYIKTCNEYANAGYTLSDCGLRALDSNETTLWQTYDNATGRYSSIAIGSIHSSKDLLCSNKVTGWYEFGR